MRLVVLYGSETGVALEASEKIVVSALCRGVSDVQWLPMDECPVERWSSLGCPLILTCSTTGQGEFPETAKNTWEVLRMSDAPNMEGLQFAVFGLGDSSYEKYNYAAKLLHNRLVNLGGSPLVDKGLGDDLDRQGYDEALQPWMKQLWGKCSLAEPRLLPKDLAPKWKVEVVKAPTNNSSPPSNPPSSSVCPSPLPGLEDIKRKERCTISTVKVNNRLTATDHFQDVRHIEFDRLGSSSSAAKGGSSLPASSSSNPAVDPTLIFEAGDALGVYPVNRPEEVKSLLKRCGLSPEDRITITPRSDSGLTRQPTQVFFHQALRAVDLFSYYLGISNTGSRGLLQLLAAFSTDEEVQERLNELADPSNIDQFNSYCHREKRSFVEVLEEFPQVQLPLDRLLSTIPALRPRYFSIASSPLELDHIALTVAVLEFKTPYGRQRRGLCSSQLCEALPGVSRFQVFIHACKLRLPVVEEDDEEEGEGTSSGVPSPPRLDLTVPLIMIGPGTGVAPLRGLIRHATQVGWKGPIHLFNGCRFKAKDFLYGAEFEELEAKATKGESSFQFKQHTAFSRDQAGGKRTYVQHLLVQSPTAKEIGRLLLQEHAVVYLCGNSKQMPIDVLNSFISIVSVFGEMAEEAAAKYLSRMRAQGRYLTDTWAV